MTAFAVRPACRFNVCPDRPHNGSASIRWTGHDALRSRAAFRVSVNPSIRTPRQADCTLPGFGMSSKHGTEK